MKNIEDDTNRWKDRPWPWIGRIKIIKMAILLKKSLQCQYNSYQIPKTFFFHRTRTNNLNISKEIKKT